MTPPLSIPPSSNHDLPQKAEDAATWLAELAQLARLKASTNDQTRLSNDIAKIVEQFKKLEQLDNHVLATTASSLSHCSYPVANGREDIVEESLPGERALAAAPEQIGDGFGVPKVVE